MKKKLNCILLVDDDFATNLYHKIVIEEKDCTQKIVVKTSGEEALNYLKVPFRETHPKPNLIFLDINMPMMTGWEFLEEYQKLSADQQAENVVVMLSTSSDPDDLKRAEENALVKEYRSKPLTAEMLEEIMDKYWNSIIEG